MLLPNTGATDESAFSALPGGGRFSNGMFSFIMNSSYFWSASENAGTKAWFRNLISSDDNVTRSSTLKSAGASVRYLKDWLFIYLLVQLLQIWVN